MKINSFVLLLVMGLMMLSSCSIITRDTSIIPPKVSKKIVNVKEFGYSLTQIFTAATHYFTKNNKYQIIDSYHSQDSCYIKIKSDFSNEDGIYCDCGYINHSEKVAIFSRFGSQGIIEMYCKSISKEKSIVLLKVQCKSLNTYFDTCYTTGYLEKIIFEKIEGYLSTVKLQNLQTNTINAYTEKSNPNEKNFFCISYMYHPFLDDIENFAKSYNVNSRIIPLHFTVYYNTFNIDLARIYAYFEDITTIGTSYSIGVNISTTSSSFISFMAGVYSVDYRNSSTKMGGVYNDFSGFLFGGGINYKGNPFVFGLNYNTFWGIGLSVGLCFK